MASELISILYDLPKFLSVTDSILNRYASRCAKAGAAEGIASARDALERAAWLMRCWLTT